MPSAPSNLAAPLIRHTGPRNLLLCFDAFDTLVRPRRPVAEQYAQVARQCGLTSISPDQVQASFRAAFKHQSKCHPNYGRASNMGPSVWWTNVINRTFAPLLPPGQSMPAALAPQLLHRFASSQGYELIEPGLPVALRRLWDGSQHPHWNVVVGVLSNSDDRIPHILESLGLRVGPLRYEHLASMRASEEHTTAAEATGLTALADVSCRRRRRQTLPNASAINTAAEQHVESLRYDIDFTCLSYDVGHEKPDHRMFTSAQAMAELIIGASTASSLSQAKDASAETKTVAPPPWLRWINIMVGDDPKTDAAGARSAASGHWHCFILDAAGEHAQIPRYIDDSNQEGEAALLQVLGQTQMSWDPPAEKILMRTDSVCDLLSRLYHALRQPPESMPESILRRPDFDLHE